MVLTLCNLLCFSCYISLTINSVFTLWWSACVGCVFLPSASAICCSLALITPTSCTGVFLSNMPKPISPSNVQMCTNTIGLPLQLAQLCVGGCGGNGGRVYIHTVSRYVFACIIWLYACADPTLHALDSDLYRPAGDTYIWPPLLWLSLYYA